MEKHFKLTDDTIVHEGKTLHRIQATINSKYADEGELGGYVEILKNLQDDAWLFDNAMVYGNAVVCENATIHDNAKVFDDACVFGEATIVDNAMVYGNSEVYGDSYIAGESKIYGVVSVFDSAHILYAMVYGEATISGRATIYGNCDGDVTIYGNVNISGEAYIYGNAFISSNNDICLFNGFGSENRTTTFFKTKDNIVNVSCGCFEGNLDEFKTQVFKTHLTDSKHYKEYMTMIELVKTKFEI